MGYLQVFEGDVGTCIIIESLRQQRLPLGKTDEGLHNFLSIPGAAHTLWNSAHAILLHHWGNHTDGQDTGIWRTWVSLDGKPDPPTAKKDYGKIMHIVMIY